MGIDLCVSRHQATAPLCRARTIRFLADAKRGERCHEFPAGIRDL
jgi:hypothetical protein